MDRWINEDISLWIGWIVALLDLGSGEAGALWLKFRRLAQLPHLQLPLIQ